MKLWKIVALLLASLGLSGCGYNTIQQQDEQVKAGWSEVVNQYQRRADLIPNLVNTVKGYAAHEKDVLTQVTEARAKVGSIQVTPEVLNDPAAFAKFQQAQGQLSGALSRLLAVSENYPQLQSRCRLARPAGATRRHRKPHYGGAQPLHVAAAVHAPAAVTATGGPRPGSALDHPGARRPRTVIAEQYGN